MDIGFAISATSADSSEIFQKIKDTINSIIDKYGISRIHVSLLVFGDNAARKISFKDQFSSPENLKSFINLIPKRSGGPVLGEALQEAVNLFKSDEGARPDVKKILVVITDKKSVSTEAQIKSAKMALSNNNISVIAVGIGNAVDPNELKIASTHDKNVITVTKDEDTETLAERIIRKARQGTLIIIILTMVVII